MVPSAFASASIARDLIPRRYVLAEPQNGKSAFPDPVSRRVHGLPWSCLSRIDQRPTTNGARCPRFPAELPVSRPPANNKPPHERSSIPLPINPCPRREVKCLDRTFIQCLGQRQAPRHVQVHQHHSRASAEAEGGSTSLRNVSQTQGQSVQCGAPPSPPTPQSRSESSLGYIHIHTHTDPSHFSPHSPYNRVPHHVVGNRRSGLGAWTPDQSEPTPFPPTTDRRPPMTLTGPSGWHGRKMVRRN